MPHRFHAYAIWNFHAPNPPMAKSLYIRLYIISYIPSDFSRLPPLNIQPIYERTAPAIYGCTFCPPIIVLAEVVARVSCVDCVGASLRRLTTPSLDLHIAQ